MKTSYVPILNIRAVREAFLFKF